MNDNEIINISICFDELREFMNANKSKYPQAKNGKVYVNLTARGRREPDKQGNDISITIAQTKEERAAKTPVFYVGAGKTFTFGNQSAPQSNNSNPIPSKADDLPF